MVKRCNHDDRFALGKFFDFIILICPFCFKRIGKYKLPVHCRPLPSIKNRGQSRSEFFVSTFEKV